MSHIADRTYGHLPQHQPGRSRRWLSRLRIDWPLMTALLLLALAGLVTVYSAGGHSLDIVGRQIVRLGLAFGLMLIIAQIPPHHIQRWSPWLFGIGTLLLIAVMIVGDIGKGAQRWLDLGVIRFQPSEMMKLAVPMMVAWILAERPLPPSIGVILVGLAAILVPFALVVKQPDLGTAMLIASSGVFVLLLAGLSWKLIGIMAALVAAIAPLAWFFGLHDYQRQRIITFLDPEHDPLGAGYHIIQSKIAIGSGGIYGKGWLNGSQSRLEYIPERSTDFIFAVFGEEFGLIGILILLALYVFIIARCLLIAVQAQDTYTRLLAGSLTLAFFVYVFVNMGMVSGILPVVGVPLPLISYGGTAVVTMMAAFGILMSIQTHRKLVTT